MQAKPTVVRTGLCLAVILTLLGVWRAQNPVEASERVAARAGEEVLGMDELRELLLLRHAFSPDGREILRHLVQSNMIDHLGDEGRVKVSQGEINKLWDRLDRDAKRAGVAGGMAAELRRTGMTPEDFRELLRRQILQQVLTRRALGLGKDASVSGEQMALWIDAEIQKRGLEVISPPWNDGVIAVCGEVEIELDAFAQLLADHLPAKEVRDGCFHLLLLRGVDQRMPDLAPEARTEAVKLEIDRRRREVEGDSAFKGLSFESLLGAQGMTLEALEQDPSVAIAALSELWVSRGYDEEGLREAYQNERSYFENHFGEALHLHAIFLRAAKFKNPWNPRVFEQAEAELTALIPRLKTLEAFAEHARSLSEDPRSKAAGGDLGWVTRSDDQAPTSLREAAFQDLDTSGGAVPEGGELLGPVRLDNGVVLIWVSERRASPSWDVMVEYVRQELKRRFLSEILSQPDVQTFRD